MHATVRQQVVRLPRRVVVLRHPELGILQHHWKAALYLSIHSLNSSRMLGSDRDPVQRLRERIERDLAPLGSKHPVSSASAPFRAQPHHIGRTRSAPYSKYLVKPVLPLMKKTPACPRPSQRSWRSVDPWGWRVAVASERKRRHFPGADLERRRCWSGVAFFGCFSDSGCEPAPITSMECQPGDIRACVVPGRSCEAI